VFRSTFGEFLDSLWMSMSVPYGYQRISFILWMNFSMTVTNDTVLWCCGQASHGLPDVDGDRVFLQGDREFQARTQAQGERILGLASKLVEQVLCEVVSCFEQLFIRVSAPVQTVISEQFSYGASARS
jgi:hypothetical protein